MGRKQRIPQERSLVEQSSAPAGVSLLHPARVCHKCAKTRASTTHRWEKRLRNVMSFQSKQQDSQESSHDYRLGENVIKRGLTQARAT